MRVRREVPKNLPPRTSALVEAVRETLLLLEQIDVGVANTYAVNGALGWNLHGPVA